MKKNLDDEQQVSKQQAAATQKQTISLPNKKQKQEEKTEENWQLLANQQPLHHFVRSECTENLDLVHQFFSANTNHRKKRTNNKKCMDHTVIQNYY